MSRDRGWVYRNPVHVVFGAGCVNELSQFVQGRVLVVTTPGGTRRGTTARVLAELQPGATLVYDRVESNPTLDAVSRAIEDLRRERVDTVVGIGGGSAMDIAKVLSLALAEPAFDVNAAVESGHPYSATEPLPVVEIPTTAGTGSEVTPFATVWDARLKRKLSIGTPKLFAKVALVDPGLTLSLPWQATLGPGLDAYAQCFEAIWNRNATPPTTALARRGLTLVPSALRAVRRDPSAMDARTDLAEAALLSGMAISQTRTALVHSMSYPLTAHFGIPHGLACAMVLPAVVAFNLEAEGGGLATAVGDAGLGEGQAIASRVASLLRELGVPEAVAAYLPEGLDLATLAEEMLTPERADNNVREANVGAVREILDSTSSWLGGAAL